MKSYITGFSDEKIGQIKKDPFFEKMLEAFKKKAEELLEKEPRRIKFSDLHLFVTTGDRSRYQSAYGDYTTRLMAFALAYKFFGEEKYLEPLADIIWNICDLETWGLPAHVDESAELDKRRCWVELVSANVGRQFGEVLCLVGEDKLPELVVRRMKHEVRERIVEGYKNYDFWWKHGSSNWSAVCIAGTLASYLYFATKEEIDEAIPGMVETARGYFRSFDADGCCMEGYAYWSYGFSYFTYFADLLKNYTEGKINMFEEETVHNVAHFLENCAINDTQCVRFSDCSEFFRPAPSLSHFLKNTYPDIGIPSCAPPTYPSTGIREYIWVDPSLAACKMSHKSKIYHEAQWFIYKSKAYNFVCKAGYNNEPHNHNDNGSFMISKNGKVTFTDPGTGEYTRQYFNEERYTILEPSSRSHSVPVINGNYQCTGNIKSTVYAECEREYAFSMENAYNEKTLKSLKRDFVMGDEEIILTDTYEFEEAPTSLVERFATLTEPRIENGIVYCGDTVLVCENPELFDLTVNTDTCVRSQTVKETLYLVDFTVKEPKTHMEFKFIFK